MSVLWFCGVNFFETLFALFLGLVGVDHRTSSLPKLSLKIFQKKSIWTASFLIFGPVAATKWSYPRISKLLSITFSRLRDWTRHSRIMGIDVVFTLGCGCRSTMQKVPIHSIPYAWGSSKRSVICSGFLTPRTNYGTLPSRGQLGMIDCRGVMMGLLLVFSSRHSLSGRFVLFFSFCIGLLPRKIVSHGGRYCNNHTVTLYSKYR